MQRPPNKKPENAFQDEELHPLFVAAYSNDIEKVQSLLSEKINPDCLSKGVTPLWIAAQQGHVEVAKLLIAAGANINFKHVSGQHVLWTAASKSNTDVVRLLLEKGVLKNEICNQSSSLFVAVQNRHLETVKELLNSKCDVDLPIQPINQTPIFKAARIGDSEMVAELINAHADVNLADRQGLTPLCVAALEGYASTVSQLLLAGANVNSVTRVGKTALSYAHQNDNDSIAKRITESGCALIDLSYGWMAVQFKKYLDFAYRTFPDKYNKDDIQEIKNRLDPGLCSGFSKLLIAMPEDQWDDFYSSLKLISIWDGSNKKISEDKELQTICEENLGNLLWLQNNHNLLSPNSPPSGSSLINFVAEEKTHKEIIFNFGFLLKKHEVENILNTILEDGKKVEIGSLSPIRHAVMIMRNASGEYVIIDDNSSVGPIKFSSIEDVSSTLYIMLCKDEDNNSLIGLNFTVYDAIDSSDKLKYKKIVSHHPNSPLPSSL